MVDGWVGCGGWEGSKECVKIAKALISPPEFWFNRSWMGPGHLHLNKIPWEFRSNPDLIPLIRWPEVNRGVGEHNQFKQGSAIKIVIMALKY